MRLIFSFSLLFNVAALGADFASGVPVGRITNAGLAEISGIVASQQNPGVLWVHNDLARPSVHAVSTNGQLLATWTLGQPMNDFEDIAVGPGPFAQLQYLFCGDIGDNAAARPNIRVYRAAEPAVYLDRATNVQTKTFPLVERFTLVYPDGSHNAEELMVDPRSGDLYVVTKEPRRARIYRAAARDLADGATVSLALAGALDFDIVSAGDVRPDGLEIILRQEEFARVWSRLSGQSIVEAFTGIHRAAPVIGTPAEPNGEGITFAADGSGYYTISEGPIPQLYYFARTNGRPALRTRHLIAPSGGLNGARFESQFVAGAATSLVLSLVFEGEVSLLLNGTEVLRTNALPSAKDLWQSFPLGNAVPDRTNTLQIEFSSPGVFDVQLRGTEPALVLKTPRRTASQTWIIDFEAPANVAALEQSSDLQTWQFAEEVAATNGMGSFSFSTAVLRAAFFRLRQ